jgi:hypothetical protein
MNSNPANRTLVADNELCLQKAVKANSTLSFAEIGEDPPSPDALSLSLSLSLSLTYTHTHTVEGISIH